MFNWLPIYKEIATWVLQYRNNQTALCDILRELEFKGNLEDEDKNGKKPLNVMDPFTFMAFFQKIKNQEKRSDYLKKLKGKIGLKSEVPKEFEGIPSAQPMSLWYFNFEKDRKGFEFNALWDLAEQAVKGELKEEPFKLVFSIPGIRIAKLSQGLFFLNPESFYPIDSHKGYLESNNIKSEIVTLQDYLRVINEVKTTFKKPFYEISHDAWKNSNPGGNKMETNEIIADIPTLNTILYGPPGTGKTYNTIAEAVKIADNNYYLEYSTNRVLIQQRFNELLIKDWEKTEGQVSFCTFHQSFSYEDFVEGIKPLKPEKGDTSIKYDVINGIFKKICRLADASNNAQQLVKENLVSFTQDEYNNAVFYKISLGDSTKDEDKEIYDYCINNNVISIGFGEAFDFTGKDESQVNEIVTNEKLDPYTAQAINYFKNYLKVGNYVVVSYGNSYIRALGKVSGEYEYNAEVEIRYKHFRKVNWIFKNVEIPVAEFYLKNLSQQTIYKLKSDFIIPSFFFRKDKPADIKVEQKKFVLIIDELNRGNVSSIFGELITLIEASKRSGEAEALDVVLPYSKDPFSVPSNVYIIGTMNTADRSIESLDTALRRRFSFKEMIPKPNLLLTEGKSKGIIDDIDLVQVLQKINERIEKLIDKDHKIGHSYFMEIISTKDLTNAFRNCVIPLLEEYFFGDFGKIGLVLGNSFIKKVDNPDFDFAGFSSYDPQIEQDLKLRPVYKINEMEEWNFKSIYEAKPLQ